MLSLWLLSEPQTSVRLLNHQRFLGRATVALTRLLHESWIRFIRFIDITDFGANQIGISFEAEVQSLKDCIEPPRFTQQCTVRAGHHGQQKLIASTGLRRVPVFTAGGRPMDRLDGLAAPLLCVRDSPHHCWSEGGLSAMPTAMRNHLAPGHVMQPRASCRAGPHTDRHRASPWCCGG